MAQLLAKTAAAGVRVGAADPLADEPAYLWPDNVQAWNCWIDVQTQWRVGMAGATGLDYAGVRAYLDEAGIEPGDERREVFAGIRAAERAVLEVWSERRARADVAAPVRA